MEVPKLVDESLEGKESTFFFDLPGSSPMPSVISAVHHFLFRFWSPLVFFLRP